MIRSLGFLVLVLLAFDRADAICGQPPETRGTTALLRGSVVACRSALPEIEASLNAGREAHEKRAQPMRDRIPNSDRLWALRPYDEIVAHRLSRVAGVIVTFAVDGHARIPTDVETGKESPAPAWHALDPPKQQELFLRLGGSSCDLLPDPLPTVIVQELVCCDVIPSSEDSCTLGLTAVSLPPESLLERLRGGG